MLDDLFSLRNLIGKFTFEDLKVIAFMHTIEPYYKWRDEYRAEEDERSPFYGRVYNEFSFTQKVYNYFIHPQWDDFGSSTLYAKILYADYIHHQAIIELIGEWNDCIHNDVMFLKQELINPLIDNNIRHFILSCENVLNFHGSDDCYYEEWYEDISDLGGTISFINLNRHVQEEMQEMGIQYYVNLGDHLNEVPWRGKKPQHLLFEVQARIQSSTKQLRY